MGLGARVLVHHVIVGFPGLRGGIGAVQDLVVLELPGDVPNYIIGKAVVVGGALGRRGPVEAVGGHELVEIVMSIDFNSGHNVPKVPHLGRDRTAE